MSLLMTLLSLTPPMAQMLELSSDKRSVPNRYLL